LTKINAKELAKKNNKELAKDIEEAIIAVIRVGLKNKKMANNNYFRRPCFQSRIAQRRTIFH
jgi:hypothetical protein